MGRCNVEAAPKIVKKEGPNCGRTFYGCARPTDDGACNFFAWGPTLAAPLSSADPSQGGSTSSSVAPTDAALGSNAPMCRCGVQCASKTARKEGPNLGRVFYGCA